MSARMTAARIVGREAEPAELKAALAEAAQGRPSFAFVAGESGVGRSGRLRAGAQGQGRREGVRVLSGDRINLGATERPRRRRS